MKIHVLPFGVALVEMAVEAAVLQKVVYDTHFQELLGMCFQFVDEKAVQN